MPFPKGKHHTEETKKKMALGHFGAKNHNFGKHLSEETKTKLRAKAVLRHPSKETKVKMREAHLGVKNNNFNKHFFGEKSLHWKGDKAKPKSGRERARKIFECPKGLIRHHKDGNPLNNAPENIMIVTPKQHSELHK